MKNLLIVLLISVLLLYSCSERKNNLKKVAAENYTSEEEKLLNEAFLQVVGDELYYSISEKYLKRIDQMQGRGIKEHEIIKYYKRHRREDSKRLIVFTRNNFLTKIYANPNSQNLQPMILAYLRQALENNNIVSENDKINSILDVLATPLKLDSVKLKATGRYELVREKDWTKIQGEYKSYGSFNCSKVYINRNKTKGAFFFERDCMKGVKCASGTLVLLIKRNNKWQVYKEISVYLT